MRRTGAIEESEMTSKTPIVDGWSDFRTNVLHAAPEAKIGNYEYAFYGGVFTVLGALRKSLGEAEQVTKDDVNRMFATLAILQEEGQNFLLRKALHNPD
jgi:hypothetical protein